MILAMIPARGGSQRIPHKNIKNFCGKPIIHYSIEATKMSNIFDEIMVSTDDEEIAKVAKKAGAKVPFIRSAKNSDNYATLVDVALEVINFYETQKIFFEVIALIYATAPFLTALTLQKAYKDFLNSKNAVGIVSVSEYRSPIQRAFFIKDRYLSMYYPENINVRSQDLIRSYFDAAQFIFMSVKVLKETKSFYHPLNLAYVIPDKSVQDIDTLEDWKIAEFKYLYKKNRKK